MREREAGYLHDAHGKVMQGVVEPGPRKHGQMTHVMLQPAQLTLGGGGKVQRSSHGGVIRGQIAKGQG